MEIQLTNNIDLLWCGCNMLCLLDILIELHLVKRNGFQQTTRSYTRPFHGELTKDNKALRATTRL